MNLQERILTQHKRPLEITKGLGLNKIYSIEFKQSGIYVQADFNELIKIDGVEMKDYEKYNRVVASLTIDDITIGAAKKKDDANAGH